MSLSIKTSPDNLIDTQKTWKQLKNKFSPTNSSRRSSKHGSPRSGSMSRSRSMSGRSSRSGSMSGRSSRSNSPRISKEDALKILSLYDTDQLSIIRRFILMTEMRKSLMAWSAWKQYIFNHRIWDLKQKKLKATKDMLEIGKSHPPGQRTEEEIKKIKDWAKYAGPQIFKSLKQSQLEDVAQALICKTYPSNHVLFLQGQKGDTFWIILNGQIKIFVEDDKIYEQIKIHNHINHGQEWINSAVANDPTWLGREVSRINGGGFGELALFEGDGLRNASAMTGKETDVILIPKAVYLRTLVHLHRDAYVTKRKINFLLQFPLFENWSKRRIIDTSYTLTREKYTKGSILISQNTIPDALIFIVIGEVRLLRMMDSDDVDDLQNGIDTSSNQKTTNNTRNRKQKDKKDEGVATWKNKQNNKHNQPLKGSNSTKSKSKSNPNTTTTTTTSATKTSVPTTFEVKTYLEQNRAISTMEPVHTRRKNPTMELSVLGKKSIVGLMAPKVYKLRQTMATLATSTRNDGSVSDHQLKEHAKLNKALNSMSTPWTAIATQDTEVFILSNKHLGTFCARSKGTNMYEALETTYHRRLYSYKDRFRMAKATKSYHGLLPPTRKNGAFSPLRSASSVRSTGDSNGSPSNREIVISMPSIMRKKLSKKLTISEKEQLKQSKHNKNSNGHGKKKISAMFGGGGNQEEDMLDTMRIRNEIQKKAKGRDSALEEKNGKFVEFGADQQNRRSMALDRALDACLEIHLDEERRKIMMND